MSRSIKRYPVYKFNSGSQKKEKRISHRLFRQSERMAIKTGNERGFPFYQWQNRSQWDLNDGRLYFGHHLQEENYFRLMRK